MSVFADQRAKQFDAIRVTIQFEDRIVGGAPKDPKLVEGWLRKGMQLEDEDIRVRMIQHLTEMGVEDISADATVDQLLEATSRVAGEIKTQGFKRDELGHPYYESRQIKAGIKETVNILFAGEKWGKRAKDDSRGSYSGKGPKAYAAERTFVKPDHLVLADDISGVDLFIGHVSGPTGSRSTIGYAEYVTRPQISFVLLTNKDSSHLSKAWPQIWTHMELNGLGAMRSQGFGQFEVIEFEPQDTVDVEEILVAETAYV